MRLPGGIVAADRGAHSQKPKGFRDLVWRHTPWAGFNGRMEMFAREEDPRFYQEGD